jgi:hypothetical protein
MNARQTKLVRVTSRRSAHVTLANLTLSKQKVLYFPLEGG